MNLKERGYRFLNWTSKYTKTDMVYVAKGSFWLILGKICGALVSFLILVAFARFASKEVYGAYQYIISMVAMVGILTLPGIDAALIRAIAKGKERTFFLCEKEKLKFGFFGFLIFLAISLWYFFKKKFDLCVSFLIAGIFFPLTAIFSLYAAFWQGKKDFKTQNKYFIFHNLIATVLLFLIILLKPKLVWVVFGYFFSFCLATFIFYLKTKNKIDKKTEEDRETISFGKHLTITYLPSTIAAQIDNVILWQFANPLAVAVYAYALRVIERLNELIPFYSLALPKMAEKNLREERIKKSIFDKFLKIFWFSIPFTVVYILLCPVFFKIFFPTYQESIIYSQVLSLILIFTPFSFLSAAFLAEAKKRELYILNFAPQLLKIALFFILIPFFGIWGGVLAILISQIFSSSLVLYFFKKL